MPGNASMVLDLVSPSPVKVPNRDSATASPQRWAAQYGQYSAPM